MNFYVNPEQYLAIIAAEPSYSNLMHKINDHDQATYHHLIDTSLNSMALGLRAGLGPDDIFFLGRAGLVHDAGKLLIQKEILAKPGLLTQAERKIIDLHANLARVVLDGFNPEVIAVASAHHDFSKKKQKICNSSNHSRYHVYENGFGYSTLELAGMVAAADVFSSLNSAERQYHGLFSRTEVAEHFLLEMGSNAYLDALMQGRFG